MLADALRAFVTSAVDRQVDLEGRIAAERAEMTRANELLAMWFRQQVGTITAATLTQVSAMAARVEAAEAATVQLRAAVDDTLIGLAGRCNELQRRVSTLGSTLAALTERDDDLAGRARRIEERVVHVDERLTATVGQLDQRLAGITHEVDAKLAGVTDQLDAKVASAVGGLSENLTGTIGTLGQRLTDTINELDEKVVGAVGEATLARIESDRLSAKIGERLDAIAVRMNEVESQVADTMDVSAAVQLDRLDELERAVAALDPDQFVLRGITVDAGGVDASRAGEWHS